MCKACDCILLSVCAPNVSSPSKHALALFLRYVKKSSAKKKANIHEFSTRLAIVYNLTERAASWELSHGHRLESTHSIAGVILLKPRWIVGNCRYAQQIPAQHFVLFSQPPHNEPRLHYIGFSDTGVQLLLAYPCICHGSLPSHSN